MYCAQQTECPVRPLPNALNDAQGIAAALGQQEGRAFSTVEILRVGQGIGAPPTKRAILDALRGFDAAPEDTTIVFLASHGMTSRQAGGEYYFLTPEVTAETLRALMGEAMSRDELMRAQKSLLSGTELTDALRRLAGRRILLIDTCQAGAAGRSSNPYALARRSASAQIALLSAARDNEQSYEYVDPKVRHGAFTYALLRSLEGRDGENGKRRLTLEQAHRSVTVQVKQNTRKVAPNATQTPVLYATPALRMSVLAEFKSPEPGHKVDKISLAR
jgi:uncharacterized caspase-like protein